MTNDTQKRNNDGIKSIELGYFILRKIADENQPLTITQISQLCNMSKSKLYRYLNSLCRIGFLKKNENAQYVLGIEIALLGLKASGQIDVQEAAEPYMRSIHKELNETVSLGIWGQNGPFIIKWIESMKSLNIGIRPGFKVNITRSATGKIFAAFYDLNKTEKLIKAELEENAIEESIFQQELAQIRKQGFVITEGEVVPGLTAITAPVFGQNGKLLASLGVIGVLGVLDLSVNSEVRNMLLEKSALLSREMGYQPKN